MALLLGTVHHHGAVGGYAGGVIVNVVAECAHGGMGLIQLQAGDAECFIVALVNKCQGLAVAADAGASIGFTLMGDALDFIAVQIGAVYLRVAAAIRGVKN